MSLFSKLFSRDGTPGESTKEDGDAPAEAANESARKPEDAAVSGGGARDAQAARGRTEQTSVATSNDKPAPGAKPEAAGKQATPTQGANKIPPLKPGAPPKRDKAPAKTMMGMPVMNVGNPPAPTPPQAAAQAPQPHAAASAARAEPARPPAAPAAAAATEAKPKTGSGTQRAVELPTAEVPTIEVRTPSARPERNSHFDAAFDAAMNALLDSKAPPPSAASNNNNASDRRAVSETFSDVAKVHAHPLRELMFQLGMGPTPRQWAAASRPVIRPLLDAAQQIGMLELVGALGAFDAALERAGNEPNPCISEPTAAAIKSAYERLCLQMPDAFSAPANTDGRRLILLESLLLQIPSLQRRMLAKLYAAGLSSLSQLSQARPDEVSAVAGIAPDVAASVVEHVQRFERERSKLGPSELRNQAIERLRAVVNRLGLLQQDFELAEADDDAEQKRVARRGREAALLELDLVLAEIGELSVIEELKRCSVQAKLRRVTIYLEQLQASA
jgi:hypothetical protein